MGLASNTLKGSDVSVTPIKLKYSNDIPSSSLASSGITLTVASNASYDMFNPSFTDDFLLYRSVRGLYYMNFISGSTSGSAYEWYPQSTAASGTFDNDYRYFPTESNAQVLVISIPRAKFGENIARASFSMTATDSSYNIVDDGNGNLIDTVASNVHVGNLLYNQGIGVITNIDYVYTLIPVPLCDVPVIITPIPVGETIATPRWIVPSPPASFEYILSTSSAAPVGSGTNTTVYTNTGSVNFTGLSSSTEYYFFLRSRCSGTNYSSWVSESFTTSVGLVPFRDGLILELESFTGSNYNGSNQMTSWVDMSGYGNTVYPDAAQYQPIYTSSYFSGQPGILFSASASPATGSVLRTSGNLNGLSGSTGVTSFVVARLSGSIPGMAILEYAKTGTVVDSYITSTGSLYLAGITVASTSYKLFGANRGNVDLSEVEDTTSYIQAIPSILSITADSTLNTRELILYRNNLTGSLTWSPDTNNSGSFESYPLAIGSSVNNGKWQSLQGYIGAVLMYNKVLTDSERTQVYNYLSSSYL